MKIHSKSIVFTIASIVGYAAAQECSNQNIPLTVANPARLAGGTLRRVDVDGNHLVFGGNAYDTVGSITTFEWNGTAWTDEQVIINPSGVSGQFAGPNSDLAISGDHLVVSDVNHNSASGIVYTYKWDGTNWVASTITLPTLSTSSYFGSCIALDGTRMVVGAWTENSQAGAIYTFEWSGTQWTQSGSKYTPPSVVAGDGFGNNCEISGDFLAVQAMYDDNGGLTDNGAVYTMTRVGTSWVQDASSPILGTTSQEFLGVNAITITDTKLAIGGATNSEINTSSGIVRTFTRSGSTWVTSGDIYGDNLVNDRFGKGVVISDDKMVVSGGISTNTNVQVYLWGGSSWTFFERIDGPNSFASSISPFGADFVISTQNAHGLGATSAGTIEVYGCNFPVPCTTHAECIASAPNGFLPSCGSTSGVCEDSGIVGSCSTAAECDIKHKKIAVNAKRLGSITQTMSISNITKIRETSKKLYDDVTVASSITQDLDIFVSGTEEAIIQETLFTNYGDDSALLAHIKSIVCPASLLALCNVEIPVGRRALLAGYITVSVTYQIDSVLFDDLVSGGTTFSDGSAFETALAALLNVNTTDIELSAASGELVIEYVVSQEATGADPLTTTNLQALADVEADVVSVTTAVVSELGLNANDITSSAIDYCTDRDCNGRGTCDVSTGVCACTDTDYWGINCETAVSCNSGVKDVNSAYCICEYPNYGQRCENSLNCTC